MTGTESLDQRLLLNRYPHWTLTHSGDVAIPGYLMLSSNEEVASLADLSSQAAAALGCVMHEAVGVIKRIIKPQFTLVFCFAEGNANLCFHLFPRMEWMRCPPERWRDAPDDLAVFQEFQNLYRTRNDFSFTEEMYSRIEEIRLEFEAISAERQGVAR